MECLLWKPKKDNCLAICDIEKEPSVEKSSSYIINSIIPYKNKIIKFFSKENLYPERPEVPFLYSDVQIVDLNDEKDFYYFYYKTGVIQDTNLNLRLTDTGEIYMLPFDNCETNQRNMICKISKKKLESFLNYKDGTYKASLIAVYIGQDFAIRSKPFTYTIEISKKEKQKKNNVYVEVKRILTPLKTSEGYLTYETNVTNIDILRTRGSIFEMIGENYKYQTRCFFKKNEDNSPLMFICLLEFREGSFRLNKFNHLSMNFIDYKYNFIVTYQKDESITREEGAEFVLITYPEVLNFTSKNDLNITIEGNIYKHYDKLTLNPKSENLKCDIGIYHSVVQCIVPKSHFKGEKSGYYYLHYPDSLGDISLYYEANPFKVILSGSFNYYNINKIICIISLLLFL